MLRVVDGNADPSQVVEALESMLAEAKAGKLTGFVALKNARNEVGWESAGRWTIPEALYAFQLWTHWLMDGC